MKIRAVTVNNRRKVFAVRTSKGELVYPFAKADPRPTDDDPIARVWIDKELASEAFTYALGSGREGTVHIEQVLEYNKDPDYLRDRLLYRLTLEAQKRVAASRLPKREIIRDSGLPRPSSIGSWIRRTTVSPSTSSCPCCRFSTVTSILLCERRAHDDVRD